MCAVLQEVQNVQYCACMNPTAGSFSITPRMQRHFATFAVQMPSVDIVRWADATLPSNGLYCIMSTGWLQWLPGLHIICDDLYEMRPSKHCFGDCRSVYGSIVEGHLVQADFEAPIQRLGQKLVDATLELHRAVMNAFLPSAVKFHYQFNLRELSNITEVHLPESAAVGRACHQ